jgi:O-antigen ligase
MSDPVIAKPNLSSLYTTRLQRIADGLAVAVAASLPWSVSATSVLVVLWLLALIPTLEFSALRRALILPAGGLPVALLLLAVVGTAWADVSWAERLHGLSAFTKLAVIPILIVQFRRSDWGQWVLVGFLVSCTLLLVLSWAFVVGGPLDPSPLWAQKQPGIPVKDYIAQSGNFTLCAFVLIDQALARWKDRRDTQALGLVLLAFLFLLNIFYVATSRTTLIVIPILLVLLGFLRLTWKQLVSLVAVATVASALVWASSPYLRYRVAHLVEELHAPDDPTVDVSAWDRIVFWRMALRTLGEAPLIGHGTGSIAASFHREGSDTAVNPHNQIFAVGMQLGLVGVAVLIAMWVAHWSFFFSPSRVGWFGLVVVTQNIVSSLFNSHLNDFTAGWVYVFGVGVIAGMVRSVSTGHIGAITNGREIVAQ